MVVQIFSNYVMKLGLKSSGYKTPKDKYKTLSKRNLEIFNCLNCDIRIRRPYRRNRKSKFCSRKCSNSYPPRIPGYRENAKIRFKNQIVYNKKLSPEIIKEIQSFPRGFKCHSFLSEKFNISKSLISQVRKQVS